MEDILSKPAPGCPPTGDGEKYAAGETIAALLSFTSICLHLLGEPKKRLAAIQMLEQHNPHYGRIVRAACGMQRGLGGDAPQKLWTP